jgi:hypothetical protein
VVNRVDLDGQTVSDQFVRSRSVDVCKSIEQQYGLIVADQVGRKQALEIGPTPAQEKAAKAQDPKAEQSAEWSRARQDIGRALGYTAGQARSFDELREALRPRGIELELTRRKDGSPAGVVFAQDGHRVKGSQVGREYSAGNLETGFAKARELGHDPAQAWQQVGQDYALAKLAESYAQAKEQQARQQPERGQSKGFGIGD